MLRDTYFLRVFNGCLSLFLSPVSGLTVVRIHLKKNQ